MILQNDPLQRALAAEQLHQQTSRKTVQGKGFGDILSQELGQSGGAENSAGLNASDTSLLTSKGLMAMMGVEISASSGTATGVSGTGKGEIAQQMTSLLDSMELYGQSLKHEGGLKNAWQMLNSMDAMLANTRSNLDNMPAPDEGLSSMLNELEILTTTEKFKFSRGDYL